MKRARSAFLFLTALSLAAPTTIALAATAAKPRAVEAMMWPDLLQPQMRGKVIYSPPPVDELDREAGSLADLQSPSLGVRKDLDGRTISIPGFIVPLSFDAQRRVTRMFLVPYFGACIHFPPPPPEQMIYVTVPGGLALKSMYDAYTLTGPMKVAVTRNAKLGTAHYSMVAQSAQPYTP